MNAMRVAPKCSSDVSAADGFVVLDACHGEILRMLEELSALLLQLELHGLTPEARRRAARIAEFFSTTARDHHQDEERHIFPALVDTGRPEVVQVVLSLQRDHDWIEEEWLDLAPHVLAVARGLRSFDLDALRAGVPVLDALYHDHIALEESLAYPAARAGMDGAQRNEMGREMAARHRALRAARLESTMEAWGR